MKKFFTFGALALALTATSLTSHARAQEEAGGEPTLADVPKAQPASDADIRTATPKIRPLSVTVDLVSSTAVVGTLTDITNLDMQTSFGTANIPLSEVAAVRFATSEEATTTVVMLNGDSITGATDVKLVTVETEWGSASINGQSIKSIMFVPNVVWSPNTGLNGKRWVLVSDKQAAEQAPTAPESNSQTPTTPPSSVQPIRNPDGSLSYPNGAFPNGSPIIRNSR